MTIAEAAALIASCKHEFAKKIVGQDDVITGILTGIVCNGHVLLEGVPGLAKTLAVKTLAEISALDFKRIQFTPDLLPSDITGNLIYESAKNGFSVSKGPIFSNIVLADEINRSSAKVQSALLEAMAEKQVTIGGTTYALDDAFFVFATQNPIESEGTYRIPESEADRFLLKLLVPYPSATEECAILVSADSINSINSSTKPQQVLSRDTIRQLQQTARSIVCDEKLMQYIVAIVNATRDKGSVHVPSDIALGASPRASIALLACARAAALFAGRDYVLPEDIKQNACAALRHRIILSFEAASDMSADDAIEKILKKVALP
ncbi:MAG: MoxR family ATPase [Treponemataceae bacterium]|nr:MAG: MoxR family ATPase [Treponemataceae bacterium]